MKKKKRGFTLVELMAVMVVGVIVLPIISSIFIQGYKTINRTENKASTQNDFRSVIMNIENDIKNISLSDINGYTENGESLVDNTAKVKYKGKEYTGRYIIDLINPKKLYFEVNFDDKKQLWECNYSSIFFDELGNSVYSIDEGKINVLISNMNNEAYIVAKNNNGILVFNMNETDNYPGYYGNVNTNEDKDIKIGFMGGDASGDTYGNRKPIFLANNKVEILSNNKEVFLDNKEVEDYFVINSKEYSEDISNGKYGKINNIGTGIQLPTYKNFGYKENIILETINDDLYLNKLENITGIEGTETPVKISDGILYFVINKYKVYLLNTNKLIIMNDTTNNLKWNKLELTDTVIICSGDIEIINEAYCTTNLSGSMIAGKNITVKNTSGSLIMYSESERRFRISDNTINSIKKIVNDYSIE